MPNGLRYAVRHNSVPPGQVSIRIAHRRRLAGREGERAGLRAPDRAPDVPRNRSTSATTRRSRPGSGSAPASAATPTPRPRRPRRSTSSTCRTSAARPRPEHEAALGHDRGAGAVGREPQDRSADRACREARAHRRRRARVQGDARHAVRRAAAGRAPADRHGRDAAGGDAAVGARVPRPLVPARERRDRRRRRLPARIPRLAGREVVRRLAGAPASRRGTRFRRAQGACRRRPGQSGRRDQGGGRAGPAARAQLTPTCGLTIR